MEKYYRFSNGKIVKRDEKGVFFSLDENGKWILDGHAMSKFYDAASDYAEIEDPLVANVKIAKQEDKFS